MIYVLGPGPILNVAPFSQSMSPWRATATHFVPKTMTFRLPENVNNCCRAPKIWILGPCMYCKQKDVLQIQKYATKIQITRCKYTTCMLQMRKLYVADAQFVYCR